jgi:hypothetical protein
MPGLNELTQRTTKQTENNPKKARRGEGLRRARRDAKLRDARVRVRTVLSGNERLTLTISRLIV